MSLEMVKRVKLEAGYPTEERVLDYLEKNASDVLAEKINADKKTLAGALAYCKGEAWKLADGGGCVCVDDETVFGWVIHFFEEDDVAEPKAEKKQWRWRHEQRDVASTGRGASVEAGGSGWGSGGFAGGAGEASVCRRIEPGGDRGLCGRAQAVDPPD